MEGGSGIPKTMTKRKRKRNAVASAMSVDHRRGWGFEREGMLLCRPLWNGLWKIRTALPEKRFTRL